MIRRKLLLRTDHVTSQTSTHRRTTSRSSRRTFSPRLPPIPQDPRRSPKLWCGVMKGRPKKTATRKEPPPKKTAHTELSCRASDQPPVHQPTKSKHDAKQTTHRHVENKLIRRRLSDRWCISRRRRKMPLAEAVETKGCAMREKLVNHVDGPLRGRGTYTYQLDDPIARVGSAPSAAGARSPLAAAI